MRYNAAVEAGWELWAPSEEDIEWIAGELVRAPTEDEWRAAGIALHDHAGINAQAVRAIGKDECDCEETAP